MRDRPAGRPVGDHRTPTILDGGLVELSGSRWILLALTAAVGPVLAWITGSVVGASAGSDLSPVLRRR